MAYWSCSWVDTDTETVCNQPAEVHRNLTLCGDHIAALSNRLRSENRRTALQAAKIHPLDSFPGYCYVILLPDGFVKIGYSNTRELLATRFKAISREYKAPVVELAVIEGGFVAEAVLHEKFRDYREPGRGERFRYSPEMAEYLDSLKHE